MLKSKPVSGASICPASSLAHLATRRGPLSSRRASHAVVYAIGNPTITRDGKSVAKMTKDLFAVGSSSAADLVVNAPNVVEEHAKLEKKGGRVFCTALVSDEFNLLADTFTWVDGNQIRPGVAYMVSPGAEVAFGEESNAYVIDFDESGTSSPMMEMLMKGMASSEEVKKQLE